MISLSLSRIAVLGLHQVLVRLTITRSFRPRFKSGIFIHPENFSNGEIVIPKRSKFNSKQIVKAMEEKSLVDGFCRKLENIIRVSLNRVKNISKEWILSVLDFEKKGIIKKKDGEFTYESIEEAFHYMSAIALEKSCVGFTHFMTIFNYIDEYCKCKRLSRLRIRSYISDKRLLFRFIKYEQIVENRSNFSFDFETMNAHDFNKFKSYIINEGNLRHNYPLIYEKIIVAQEQFLPRTKITNNNYGTKNKSENHAIGVIKRVMAVFHWMSDQNLIHNNPFTGFEIGQSRFVRRPVYLTIQERNHLSDFDLSDYPYLSIQRDIFVFQCLVGCRYGDLVTLTSDNITNGILEYVPQKTRNSRMPAQPRIPLVKMALKLVEKYRGVDEYGRLFPFCSITKYNKSLKEIFAIAGLDRIVISYDAQHDVDVNMKLCDVVSSHMARRTFVGNIYKKTKDPCIVSAMSGHVEGSRAFSRYRDIDDDDLREVIEQIEA